MSPPVLIVVDVQRGVDDGDCPTSCAILRP
jgi:hypothetical protein